MHDALNNINFFNYKENVIYVFFINLDVEKWSIMFVYVIKSVARMIMSLLSRVKGILIWNTTVKFRFLLYSLILVYSINWRALNVTFLLEHFELVRGRYFLQRTIVVQLRHFSLDILEVL